MKLFRILLLTVITVFISATLSLAQKREVAKMQAPLEYAHYQKSWFKNEKKALKKAISASESLHKAPKGTKRRNAKLMKLRNDLSEVSARKEGNDE